MAARLLHRATGLDSLRAAQLVSWASLLLAVPLFAEEARARLGPDRGAAPLPFLLLYPVSFFFAAVYTESTFLLVALLAFRAVRHGRFGPAASCAFLAGLARAPAAALGPALALAWFLARRDDRRRLAPAAALAVLPAAGVLSWVHGVGFAFGEPGLFFRSMSAWRHAAGSPFAGVVAFLEEPVRYARTGWFREHPGAVVPYVFFALLLVVGAWQIRRRRLADAAWTLGAAALAMSTGTADGLPRYSLTVYPVFFALAEAAGERPLLGRLWLALSAPALLLNSAYFVNWHFVS
jgi:hypothetical protein